MNRAISTVICIGLFLFLVAGTSHAQLIPIRNCTTISTPGSYILTNNITATPSNILPVPQAIAKACIVITADFVTLNLAGFAITASNLGSTLATGIDTPNGTDLHGIYVHDGTVANFSVDGVLLVGVGHTVEHIRALNNGRAGIQVYGVFAIGGGRLVGNTLISNQVEGIYVACPAVVLENAAAGNGNGSSFQQIEESPPGSCTSQENSPASANIP